MAALAPSDEQESDETYLISEHAENVKIRDGLMDIKVLREIDSNGLEQWTPIMKAAFPLGGATLEEVLSALHLPPEHEPHRTYSSDEFFKRFITPGCGVRVVQVHKRRVRYIVDGCMAELSDVTANGRPSRTIAVESEDGVAVLRAVRGLGLSGYVNTNYPRALSALIDGQPQRYAVIDVGTNSVKFHLAELGQDGRWQTIADLAEITRLGEGLAETGVIGEAALERTIAAISSMVDQAKYEGASAIVAVGTAGLRIAANAAAATEAIMARTGVQVEVVSGEDEARLAYLAAKTGLGLAADSIVVFDTGGGSSQFTFGSSTNVDERFSVDVGAARYTERFGLDRAVSADTLCDAIKAISADLSRLDGRSTPDALVGMGGAVTNIAAVRHGLSKYDADIVQGTVLDRAEIDRQIDLYCARSADERRRIVGLQPKRAEVILAGACIVRTVMDKLGKSELKVSDRGLRHGVLIEKFGP